MFNTFRRYLEHSSTYQNTGRLVVQVLATNQELAAVPLDYMELGTPSGGDWVSSTPEGGAPEINEVIVKALFTELEEARAGVQDTHAVQDGDQWSLGYILDKGLKSGFKKIHSAKTYCDDKGNPVKVSWLAGHGGKMKGSNAWHEEYEDMRKRINERGPVYWGDHGVTRPYLVHQAERGAMFDTPVHTWELSPAVHKLCTLGGEILRKKTNDNDNIGSQMAKMVKDWERMSLPNKGNLKECVEHCVTVKIGTRKEDHNIIWFNKNKNRFETRDNKNIAQDLRKIIVESIAEVAKKIPEEFHSMLQVSGWDSEGYQGYQFPPQPQQGCPHCKNVECSKINLERLHLHIADVYLTVLMIGQRASRVAKGYNIPEEKTEPLFSCQYSEDAKHLIADILAIFSKQSGMVHGVMNVNTEAAAVKTLVDGLGIRSYLDEKCEKEFEILFVEADMFNEKTTSLLGQVISLPVAAPGRNLKKSCNVQQDFINGRATPEKMWLHVEAQNYVKYHLLGPSSKLLHKMVFAYHWADAFFARQSIWLGLIIAATSNIHLFLKESPRALVERAVVSFLEATVVDNNSSLKNSGWKLTTTPPLEELLTMWKVKKCLPSANMKDHGTAAGSSRVGCLVLPVPVPASDPLVPFHSEPGRSTVEPSSKKKKKIDQPDWLHKDVGRWGMKELYPGMQDKMDSFMPVEDHAEYQDYLKPNAKVIISIPMSASREPEVQEDEFDNDEGSRILKLVDIENKVVEETMDDDTAIENLQWKAPDVPPVIVPAEVAVENTTNVNDSDDDDLEQLLEEASPSELLKAVTNKKFSKNQVTKIKNQVHSNIAAEKREIEKFWKKETSKDMFKSLDARKVCFERREIARKILNLDESIRRRRAIVQAETQALIVENKARADLKKQDVVAKQRQMKMSKEKTEGSTQKAVAAQKNAEEKWRKVIDALREDEAVKNVKIAPLTLEELKSRGDRKVITPMGPHPIVIPASAEVLPFEELGEERFRIDAVADIMVKILKKEEIWEFMAGIGNDQNNGSLKQHHKRAMQGEARSWRQWSDTIKIVKCWERAVKLADSSRRTSNEETEPLFKEWEKVFTKACTEENMAPVSSWVLDAVTEGNSRDLHPDVIAKKLGANVTKMDIDSVIKDWSNKCFFEPGVEAKEIIEAGAAPAVPTAVLVDLSEDQESDAVLGCEHPRGGSRRLGFCENKTDTVANNNDDDVLLVHIEAADEFGEEVKQVAEDNQIESKASDVQKNTEDKNHESTRQGRGSTADTRTVPGRRHYDRRNDHHDGRRDGRHDSYDRSSRDSRSRSRSGQQDHDQKDRRGGHRFSDRYGPRSREEQRAARYK